MPWDIGAGIAGAAKVGGDLMLDSVRRERNLADARSMEDMKVAIEQEKQKRIAEIVGGVSRTKDVEIAGPTEDGSSLGTTKQQKTEHEYSREVGDELTKRGLINEAGKFYDRADKHEDRTERASDRDEDRKVRAAAQASADEKWRKTFEETVRHNKTIEARAGAERISPAARAQLELASTQVSSAHKEETLAAKSLEAMRRNPLANPEQIAQAEQEYKFAKEGVRQAIRNYDELGAGHYGDKWKRSSEVVPTPAVPAGAPIEIRYKGTTPYKMGPNGTPVPATAEDVARAVKQKAGGVVEKETATAVSASTGLINDNEGLHRANPEHRKAMNEVETIETRLSYLKQTDAAPATIRQVEADLVAAKQKVRALQFRN